MNGVPISHCIGTAHKFRRLAEEASNTSLAVLAKHLDLPMDDAETVDFLRTALRGAYAEISEALHKDRIEHARAYATHQEPQA
jgi:hypothetical protein